MNNREIKFRHFDEYNKEMLYSDKDFYSLSDFFDNHPYKHSEAMQFTGMKDKNGVDIYEGDLVRFNEGRRIDVAEVRYSDIYGYWFANNCECARFQSCEVIGNIHQNTKLLKDCK